jgi:hypothetical protein
MDEDITLKDIPFHPDIVNSVKELINQFEFCANGQAAAAKVKNIQSLLDAFNDGDYSKCDSNNLKFFQDDCKRLYDEAITSSRVKQRTLAGKILLDSINTSLEQFMGSVDKSLDVSFEKSPYYNEKYQEKLKEWYPVEKRQIIHVDIYKEVYNGKKADLKREEDKKKDDNNKEHQLKLDSAIRDAKIKLSSDISSAEKSRPLYKDSLFKKWEDYFKIDEIEKINNFSTQHLGKNTDWSSFINHYNSEKNKLKEQWEKQMANARWVEPLRCFGNLSCSCGVKFTNDELVCGSCQSAIFWLDGPNKVAECISCRNPHITSDKVSHKGCSKETNCKVRPSLYVP